MYVFGPLEKFLSWFLSENNLSDLYCFCWQSVTNGVGKCGLIYSTNLSMYSSVWAEAWGSRRNQDGRLSHCYRTGGGVVSCEGNPLSEGFMVWGLTRNQLLSSALLALGWIYPVIKDSCLRLLRLNAAEVLAETLFDGSVGKIPYESWENIWGCSL